MNKTNTFLSRALQKLASMNLAPAKAGAEAPAFCFLFCSCVCRFLNVNYVFHFNCLRGFDDFFGFDAFFGFDCLLNKQA